MSQLAVGQRRPKGYFRKWHSALHLWRSPPDVGKSGSRNNRTETPKRTLFHASSPNNG
ncbi:hypothetical protein AcV7_005363 [Taiwanofungus camphoratus]|nr:hypothetical protein AcV7_005363 [Antrodia cinnamomea]